MAIRRRLGTRFVEQDPPPDPYKTAEEMEKHCCVPTPKVQCYERYIGPIYPDMEEAMKNAGITPRRDGVYDGTGTKDGRLTRIAWRPRRNPCGKVIERVKMDPKNCCDEVEPLVYDTGNSVSVLEPGTHGNVYFTGGKFPVLVKLRGNGFTLDGYSQREGWIDGPGRGFTVYAHEFACGSAPITLDDGCSVARGSVRCTTGRWTGYCHVFTHRPDRCDYPIGAVNVYLDRCEIVNKQAFTSNYDRDIYCCADTVESWRWYPEYRSWGRTSAIYAAWIVKTSLDDLIASLPSTTPDYPGTAYPNGPGDAPSYCSHPEFPCMWIC